MATTNYSLPTLESTALFDLVTDYNALASATDAALAQVAGLIPTETVTEMQGQISALQTLTGSQGTQITTLQSQMSTANGNISTLQSGLKTANSNIGKLQTGLQTANQNISNNTSALNTVSNMLVFKYENVKTIDGYSINSNQYIDIFYNEDKSLFKIGGSVTHTGNATKTLIPGTSNMYGFKVASTVTLPTTEAITYNNVGITFQDGSYGYNFYGSTSIILSTDGHIYILPGSSPSYSSKGSFNITFTQPLLTVKNLNVSIGKN